MKMVLFNSSGTFYHKSRPFKNCVNGMTAKIFRQHFFYGKPITEAIKAEADKMPKGLKQFYADLFMLTILKRAKYEYTLRKNKA